MRLKTCAVAAILAVAVAGGSAHAADDFSTLNAVPGAPLTAGEMGEVVGMASLTLATPTTTCTTLTCTQRLSTSSFSTSSSFNISGGLALPHPACPGTVCGKSGKGKLIGWSASGPAL